MKADPPSILSNVCARLTAGDLDGAAVVLRTEYAFEPVEAIERKYGEAKAVRVFLRDGFINRYSGARLVFPGTLRLLSLRLPAEFPHHPKWKMSETHDAYWELSTAVDHVVPVTPPRPTAMEWSSVSVEVDAAHGPNLTGVAGTLGWAQDPHEGGSADELTANRRPTRIDRVPNMQRPERT